MGKPRGRTDLYRIWRLAERFPNWIPTPDCYFRLSEDHQALAYAYELVREAEEALVGLPSVGR